MNKKNRDEVLTIAFYNVENLFDTINNKYTNDSNYTPKGKLAWDYKRYFKKLKKISYVISQIGKEASNNLPVLVGLVEVENTKVLNDLVNHKNLSDYGYRYVHFDSSDRRGIDTALLYRDSFFDPVDTKTYPLNFINEDGVVEYSRDVLLVSGFLNNELIHIIVNHWPSRREGVKETEHKRIKASELVAEIIEEISEKDTQAKIIIMGDFNDNPTSKSIKDYLVTEDFFNPMQDLYKQGLGTLTFQKKWFLFDQIIVSKNFLNQSISNHHFLEANIFDKKWLQVAKGKLKGSPHRTYIGPWYKGGFSDHFPVYITLEKQ